MLLFLISFDMWFWLPTSGSERWVAQRQLAFMKLVFLSKRRKLRNSLYTLYFAFPHLENAGIQFSFPFNLCVLVLYSLNKKDTISHIEKFDTWSSLSLSLTHTHKKKQSKGYKKLILDACHRCNIYSDSIYLIVSRLNGFYKKLFPDREKFNGRF